MKSFSMLRSGPMTDFGFSPNRWYVDGSPVSQAEYRRLDDVCTRKDSFHSYSRAGRHYVRHVAYI